MMPAMTGGEARFHHSGPYTQPSSAKRRQAPLSNRSAARTCASFIACVSRLAWGSGDQPKNRVGADLLRVSNQLAMEAPSRAFERVSFAPRVPESVNPVSSKDAQSER